MTSQTETTTFHLTVPSDTNKDLYPNNKANDFKVELSHPIHLDTRGDWEMALNKIIVPSKVKEDKTLKFWLLDPEGRTGHVKVVSKIGSLSVFLSSFNKALAEAKQEAVRTNLWKTSDSVTLDLDDNPPKLTIRCEYDSGSFYHHFKGNGIRFSPALAKVLGLHHDTELWSVNYFQYWNHESIPGVSDKLNMKRTGCMWLSLFDDIDKFQEAPKIFLPDLTQSAYLNYKDGEALINDLTEKIANSQPNGAAERGDVWTLYQQAAYWDGIYSKKLIFQIQSKAGSKLGFMLSPALAMVLGINRPESDVNKPCVLYDPPLTVGVKKWVKWGMQGSTEISKHGVKRKDTFILNDTLPIRLFQDHSLQYFIEGLTSHSDQYPPCPDKRDVVKKGDLSLTYFSTDFSFTKEVDVYFNRNKQLKVYCNLLQPREDAGNKPLLRHVTRKRKMSQETNDLMTLPVTRTVYFPLKQGTREIHRVHFQVFNEYEEPVPFVEGKTLVDVTVQPVKRKRLNDFTMTVNAQEDIFLEDSKQIDPKEKWEVGLVDLLYPYKWINVKEKEMKITWNKGFSTEDKVFYIPPGFYASTSDLLRKLTELLKKHTQHNVLIWDDRRKGFHNPIRLIMKQDWRNNMLHKKIHASIKVRHEDGNLQRKTASLGRHVFCRDVPHFLSVMDDLFQKLDPSLKFLKHEDGRYVQPPRLVFNQRIEEINFDARLKKFLNEPKITTHLKHLSPEIKYHEMEDPTMKIPGGHLTFNEPLSAILGLYKSFSHNLHLEEPDYNKDMSNEEDKIMTSALSRGRGHYFTFPQKADLDRGFRLFYIYAPELVEEGHVGHVMAPLLQKIIPTQVIDQEVDHRDFHHHEVQNPVYMPLKKGLKEIKKFRVDIRDELGRSVDFLGHKEPIVTLEFRLTHGT